MIVSLCCFMGFFCYSLLLELKQDFATAMEMYETALSSLAKVKDVCKVWTRSVLICLTIFDPAFIMFLSSPCAVRET